jgi:outer membrane protein OmpA-like peptidoglycan-associated protein
MHYRNSRCVIDSPNSFKGSWSARLQTSRRRLGQVAVAAVVGLAPLSVVGISPSSAAPESTSTDVIFGSPAVGSNGAYTDSVTWHTAYSVPPVTDSSGTPDTYTFTAVGSAGCSINPDGSNFQYTSVGTCLITATTTGDTDDHSNGGNSQNQESPGGEPSIGAIGTLTLTVNPAQLTVTASSETVAVGSAVNETANVTGATNGDTASLSAVTFTYVGTGSTSYGPSTTAPSSPGTYSVTPSAATIAVTPSTDSVGYSSSYNYVAGSLTITGSLVVTASSTSINAGGSFIETASVSGLAGSDHGSVTAVTFTYAGTGATSYGPSTSAPTNPGTYSVTPSNVTVTITPSSDQSLYPSSSFTYVAGSVTINALGPITVTASSEAISAGSTFTESAAASGFQSGDSGSVTSVTFTYAGTGSTTYGPSTSAPTAPGSYSVTPSNATVSISPSGHQSYYSTSYVYLAGTVTIAPVGTLVVSASSETIAPGASFTETASVGGLLSGDTGVVTSVTFTYRGTGSTSYGPSTSAPTAPGTYSVTPSNATVSVTPSADQSHYSGTVYVPGTLVIAAFLVIRASSATLHVGDAYAPSSTVAGLGSGDTAVVTSCTYTFSGTGSTTYGPSSVVPTAVGTYLVTPSNASVSISPAAHQSWYSSYSYAPGTLTITGGVTVTASSESITAGDPVVETAVASNLALGDTGVVTSVTFTYAGVAGTSYGPSTSLPTASGAYSVTPSAAVVAISPATHQVNYDGTFKYVAGSLIIAPAPIVIPNNPSPPPPAPPKTRNVTIVPFGEGSYSLTVKLKSQVRALALIIKQKHYHSVTLAGYTDNVFTPAFNLVLIQNRATVVMNELKKDLKALRVNGVTISIAPGTSFVLVSTNTTAQGRALNRRVVATLRAK